MVKLVDFFRLIRFKNLLIIALSQYLVRYALIIPMTDSRSLSDLQFFYLVLSTLFIAAAGYIPDARGQVTDARFFSQSSKIVYDESVSVETVAKHIADQCQQYTQYAGARPIGVALIIGGIDENGNSLFLTDPSGAYVPYNAVAIGANSDKVTEFLKKEYKLSEIKFTKEILAKKIVNRLQFRWRMRKKYIRAKLG